jgi:hypothetical protein
MSTCTFSDLKLPEIAKKGALKMLQVAQEHWRGDKFEGCGFDAPASGYQVRCYPPLVELQPKSEVQWANSSLW